MACLCLWLGVRLPLSHVGRPNDVSYGMYIYGFPGQQTLALVGVQRLGVAAFVLLGIAGTVPLAVLSWFVVEKRAMRHRRWGSTLHGRLRAQPGQHR